MNNPVHIAEQYLSVWNERDAAARRAKVARAFTLEASYVDPMMRGAGHEGIDAMIGAAQGHFPGMRFELDGAPDGHNDVVRFSWTLGLPGEAPVARGTDMATVDPDGRLSSVTGFLNQA
ncbi:nuclear transport factor 2 family protein [Pseudoduganella namucuonensis]|uniref:SnoaL-like domain-containing protein n=1 Tax=Pseudoduganella namucuonensis TaxID=1035707 RepID=A0A1I7L3B9_9BURK|nr:nuclear transport factor 2 family protein [Pseudoduganella namucuonensis]SFV04006.1 SnoaL-like domain-containing protein [Pseudoduganella namucuonensis]